MSQPPEWALPAWDATEGEVEDAGGRPGADRLPPAPAGTLGLRILGVSEVTRVVRDAVRGDERLRDVWVEGEVGRVTVSSAGHAYFTLKDERSQLACVFFRDDRLRSPFEPGTGLRVVAQGRIDVFETQGVYQLYVAALQPAGFGDLALRLEALKAKLAAEGLFDSGRKRPVPRRPATIAVVTSPVGAVWHDIRTVFERRWPLTRVVLVPCRVQGTGAAETIVAALRRAGRWAADGAPEGGRLGSGELRSSAPPEVIILARGGGSLEDLWPFNDEAVVRAVAASPIPVVAGVGHEVDVTLVDFAADLRAPTPTAAAELVTPDRAEMAVVLAAASRRLALAVGGKIGSGRNELAAEWRAIDRLSPTAQLATARERAGLLLDRAGRAVRVRLAAARRGDERAAGCLADTVPVLVPRERRRLESVAGGLPSLVSGRLGTARSSLAEARAGLVALGPQATLERGYAIVRRRADGRILRDPEESPAGTPLAIRLALGDLGAVATAGGDDGRRAPRTTRGAGAR